MNRAVVDSSVLIAALRREPNADQFLLTVDEVVVSTVILTEVISKLISVGLSAVEAWDAANTVMDRTVPFDEQQSRLAGELIRETKKHGLSLGDRACLALGLMLDLPVYTADRAWKDVQVGVEIFVVR